MKKKLIITLLAVCFVMGTLGSSFAIPDYLTNFSSAYPASGSSSFSCSLCHTSVPTRNAYGTAYGAGHNFLAIETADSDGDSFSNLTEINAGTNPGDPASFPAPVTCTSFTYSAFGACQSNNTQTRTVTSSSPTGCTGGTPVLTQACTFVPPVTTCTSFTYSDFGACQSNNTQSRTVTSSSPTGCTGGTPVLTQACTFVPPATPCTSFTYSDFGACQSNNTQSRTVTSSSPTGCTGGTPVLTQACTFVPPVTPCTSFTYSDFGACQSDNTQSRTVTSSSPTGCTGGTPVLTQACTFVPPGTTSVTITAAEGTGQVTIETLTGGTSLTDVAAISSSAGSVNQGGKPSGFTFNNGLVSFKLNGVAVGGQAQVKITLPAAIPAGSKVYKTDATGFHEYTNASISGNTITLTLTDGGSGDNDGAANGSITDPVGVASPVVVASDDDGGGCSIGSRSSGTATALADSAIILSPLLALAAARFFRRRKVRAEK